MNYEKMFYTIAYASLHYRGSGELFECFDNPEFAHLTDEERQRVKDTLDRANFIGSTPKDDHIYVPVK